jgi:thioredoxin reductase (NADPH)
MGRAGMNIKRVSGIVVTLALCTMMSQGRYNKRIQPVINKKLKTEQALDSKENSIQDKPIQPTVSEKFNIKQILNKENIIPIVIIGAGPAGLTAGMYAIRTGMYTVVFTGPTLGGQLTETSYVENWPGVKKLLGYEIMQTLQQQAEEFGTIIIEDTIIKVDFDTWPFVLHTASGAKVYALSVIIATGAASRKLGIVGELDYWGHGVTACAICDCVFFKDKDVIIVGSGDAAMEEAIQLATYAKNVTILVRSNRMRAAHHMQDKLRDYENIKVVYNKHVIKVVGDGTSVVGLEIQDSQTEQISTIKAEGLFLAIGKNPNTELFASTLAINDDGYIEVDSLSQATSKEGIFAAGDVENSKVRQAVVASAHGCVAALETASWLRDVVGLTDVVVKRIKPLYFSSLNAQQA